MTVLILDNEAVQALVTRHHPKFEIVVAHLESHARRGGQRQLPDAVWVPTTVRVEAGWDRTDPSTAHANRLNLRDRPLDSDRANAAARLVQLHGVSPADAHIGAMVETLGDEVVIVLTSDPKDIARVCPPRSIRIVRI